MKRRRRRRRETGGSQQGEEKTEDDRFEMEGELPGQGPCGQGRDSPGFLVLAGGPRGILFPSHPGCPPCPPPLQPPAHRQTHTQATNLDKVLVDPLGESFLLHTVPFI